MPNSFTFTKPRTNPQQTLEVVLGSHTIKAFVAAPRNVYVVGIVRWGMEFGLLAKTQTGGYVRINGSQAQTLDHADVETAIAKACATGRGASYAMSRAAQEAHAVRQPAVTVSKRKHRKIDPLLTSNGYLQ
jgi:hypothetical protein